MHFLFHILRSYFKVRSYLVEIVPGTDRHNKRGFQCTLEILLPIFVPLCLVATEYTVTKDVIVAYEPNMNHTSSFGFLVRVLSFWESTLFPSSHQIHISC